MFIYNNPLLTEKDKKELINEYETKFYNSIKSAAEQYCNEEVFRILTLSGPTCSGKTTTSSILTKEFANHGKSVKIVSIDDFFRDRNMLTDKYGNTDYETIAAIDFEYFAQCIEKILENKAVSLPKYDFNTGKRSSYEEYTPHPEEILIFEGIQAVYPEILALFPHEYCSSLFIHVADNVNAYGNYFENREIRFVRRLVRDFYYRNADPDFTMYLWEGVVKNEDINIIPNIHRADVIINSFMPYEFNVMKPYVQNIIKTSKISEQHHEFFKNLYLKYENIPIIESELVPKTSVFREFIV